MKVVDDSKDTRSMAMVTAKLSLEKWLRVLDRQDIVGEWEIESDITGDDYTRRLEGYALQIIKIRLSKGATWHLCESS